MYRYIHISEEYYGSEGVYDIHSEGTKHMLKNLLTHFTCMPVNRKTFNSEGEKLISVGIDAYKLTKKILFTYTYYITHRRSKAYV
jgi:hypothetical protein